MSDYIIYNGELYHWGVKGMKWGVRRYQNEDGSYTPAGQKHNAKKLKGANSRDDIKNDPFIKEAAKKISPLVKQEKEAWSEAMSLEEKLEEISPDYVSSSHSLKEKYNKAEELTRRRKEETRKIVESYLGKYSNSKANKLGYKSHNPLVKDVVESYLYEGVNNSLYFKQKKK